MEKHSPKPQHRPVPQPAYAVRDERLTQLLDSCHQEVLRQIIGPFGLSPAMFADKDGGSVTTQHNAEQGIFAKESEQLDRKKDYDYKQAKTAKMEQAVKSGAMDSQEFHDIYTGNSEPTKRTRGDGKLVMNAELDHTIPVKEIHGQGGWMKDKDGRDKLSSIDENLNYTTHQANRSKSAKSPEDALSEEKGYDQTRIKPIVEKAREAIDKELPSTSDRLKYHSEELAKEGGAEAATNALRQALGVLLHEFVNGSFVELKLLLKDRDSAESFIDRLIVSLKRVTERVIENGRQVLDAVVHGGVQGFASNLLTFMINNLVTTSKKVVSMIRESMRSLWRAIKLIINPPENITPLELMREVSKIIAGVVTMGVGMLMEESVKGFIMSIPLLAPLAEGLAAALTAIMTGISGALVIYGIDRLFDWLGSKGTELLGAQEAHLDAQAAIVERLQAQLASQFESSRLFDDCAAENRRIQGLYANSAFHMEGANIEAGHSVFARAAVIEKLESNMELAKRFQAALKSI